MRGRVMALRVGVALGRMTIGAPAVGWVANRFGPRCAVDMGAAAGFTAALVAVYVLAPAKGANAGPAMSLVGFSRSNCHICGDCGKWRLAANRSINLPLAIILRLFAGLADVVLDANLAHL
jgi:MFS family permease